MNAAMIQKRMSEDFGMNISVSRLGQQYDLVRYSVDVDLSVGEDRDAFVELLREWLNEQKDIELSPYCQFQIYGNFGLSFSVVFTIFAIDR